MQLPLPSPAVLQTTLLALVPQGWQHTARRNAWAGMSSDAARARARREAEQALQVATARADLPVAQAR